MRIDDDEIPSDLPDSARMQRVESSLQFQKRLIIMLGASTVILVSSFVTGALMLQDRGAQSIAAEPAGTSFESEISELRKRLASIEKGVAESGLELSGMSQALQRLQVIERTAQVEKMNEVLRQQERGYREYLRNLKDGMFDLSRMVAGSRTWLDEYSQRLDRAITDSEGREARLQEISSLQPLETPTGPTQQPVQSAE